MADYRNVWTLIAAVFLLQLAGGIMGVVTPLGLEAMALDETVIGVIAAVFAFGFMLGAWVSPRAIMAFGNIRVFSMAAALNGVSTLSMALTADPFSWSVIRFVQGAAYAMMFASAESWISSATPAPARGGVLGLYHLMAKAALLLGPFLILGMSPTGFQPFILSGIFLTLALVPVCLTRRGEPVRHGRRALGPIALMKIAPAAVWASFLAGVINTGGLALVPVWALTLAPEGSEIDPVSLAATSMAAAWLGGLISQWPVGRISDRMDRRLVVAAMGAVSCAAAVAIALLAGRVEAWVLYGLLGVWGAGSLSFYGVSVAHGVDRAQHDEIAGLMSGLLFVWAAGSVIGPPLAGLAMKTPYGDNGLFVFVAGFTALLVFAMLWRRGARAEVPESERAPWEMARPTSVSSTEIDPRTDPI